MHIRLSLALTIVLTLLTGSLLQFVPSVSGEGTGQRPRPAPTKPGVTPAPTPSPGSTPGPTPAPTPSQGSGATPAPTAAPGPIPTSTIRLVPTPSSTALRWSAPATWPNGRVPTRSDDVVIPAGRVIELDIPNAEARRLTVRGTLTKRPNTNVQLTMYGNLIVDQSGLVDFSRPDGSTWFVHFMVTTETQFVGGGMEPIDSDFGWWVVGSGRVNLQGDPKTPWTRLTGSAPAGATSITVQNATGWRIGDEIAVAPSDRPPADGDEAYTNRFDVRTIVGISGATITLSAPLTYAHPAVTFPVYTNSSLQSTTFGAEVLNLTRTGRIEGSPGLRTHFFLRNTSPVQQVLRYVQYRHLGPRTASRRDARLRTEGVLGRWGGPHFHMNGNNSNGSLVEGTVARDYGSHAYIPHDSNGLTFRANIAYDGFDEAFWWDPPPAGPAGSNHLLLDGNVVARNRGAGEGLLSYSTAIWMGHGNDFRDFPTSEVANNRAINNVAVGNRGHGFVWPDDAQGAWRFDAGNVAHNNALNGIFAWRNNPVETIANFVAYYNNAAAILHGAYGNAYLYRDISLYGNHPGGPSFEMHAFGSLQPSVRVQNIYSDGLGLHQEEVRAYGPQDDFGFPTELTNANLRGYTRAGLTVDSATDTNHAVRWVVRNLTTSGNRYWITTQNNPGTLVIDYDLRLRVRRVDQPGTLRPEWNARVLPQ